MGCLAKDFLPASITFSWLNNKAVNVTNGVKKFPPVISSVGTYSATTQLSVSTNDWSEEKPYVCLAKHPNGDQRVSVDWTSGRKYLNLFFQTTGTLTYTRAFSSTCYREIPLINP